MVTRTIKLSRGLKIAHLNVNRLLSKIHSLRDLLETHRFDVLTVSETWLTSNILDSEISIEGYHTARRDRSHSVKSRGGGSLIYVRNGIQFTFKESFSTTGSECLWIEVTRKFCKPLFICSVYRPEEHKIDDFIVDLENGLNQVPDRAEVCLLGDFNIDYANRSIARRRMERFASQFGFCQLLSDPTRVTEFSRTTIDLIFVNNNHRISQSGVIHLPISDHSLVFCVMKSGVPKAQPRTIDYRSYKNYDKNAFLSDLNQVPWSVIDATDDVDEAICTWNDLFCEVADIHAPTKSRKIKGNPCPWMTSELTNLMQDRDYHHRKAIRSNSSYHWQMFKKLRKRSNNKLKLLK